MVKILVRKVFFWFRTECWLFWYNRVLCTTFMSKTLYLILHFYEYNESFEMNCALCIMYYFWPVHWDISISIDLPLFVGLVVFGLWFVIIFIYLLCHIKQKYYFSVIGGLLNVSNFGWNLYWYSNCLLVRDWIDVVPVVWQPSASFRLIRVAFDQV